MIRQPIITVCGHVDHGKTSILDCLRDSSVQESEAGGITQKISFTAYPLEQLKKACPLIAKSGISLKIPGFLFIDTPGHAAFTNIRKRGGSLADIAVLVIDINKGIEPQTAEVIQILKTNKTPFLIALNKIDNISGWRSDAPSKSIKESIETQAEYVRQIFNERYLTLIGSLNSHGFDADLFYNISDFTKSIALIPTSARTKQGIQELIMMLCGLSQKYLENKLSLGKEARGVVLEIKKDKSSNFLEAILYDGELNKGQEIAVSNLDGDPIISKIRSIEEILPLSSKFTSKDKVVAATGIRLQLSDQTEVLPGMPFLTFNNNLDKIKQEFKKQLSDNIQTDKNGIIVKADSLGSLEALLVLLRQSNVPVLKASIGSINKKDVISAKANLEINELDAVVVGFNVELDEEAKEISTNVKILRNEVVYRLIDDLVEWRSKKAKEIEKLRMMELATIAKLEILPQYVFRNSNPCVFGVRVDSGRIKLELPLIDDSGEKVARIKSIEADKNRVSFAEEGGEVAISLPGTNFERQLQDKKFLYSDISESQFKTFKKNKDLLSEREMRVLQEISVLKRRDNPNWGI